MMPVWVEVPAFGATAAAPPLDAGAPLAPLTTSSSSSELSELELEEVQLEPALYGTRPFAALAIVEDPGSWIAV